jgi:soluble cytochrome b562
MTRDRGIPDRRSASGKPLPGLRPSRRPPAAATKPATRQATQQPDRNLPAVQRMARSAGPWQQRLLGLATDWRFLTTVGLGLTGGLTALSIAFLFKLPALPNCPEVFWPLASGSLRMQCAQLAAGKQTVTDLAEAIKLLGTLEKDHPLYGESSRLIEQWSTDLLDLGEKDFQAGKLKEAINAAKQIPQTSAAHALVADRIKKWETIWADAEAIYAKVGAALQKQDTQSASTYAAKLLSVENEFWQNKKYQEVTDLITATRADITRLGKGERALDGGGVDEVVAALKEVGDITEASLIRKDAEAMMPKLGRRLLDLAQDALDRKDYNRALEIANKIPDVAQLNKDVDSFRTLARAQSKAWEGGVSNLEEAIADAQRIGPGTSLYERSQRLIARWQAESRDVAQLEKAKQLAQSGDLQGAMSQASQIPGANPRGGDAQKFLQQTKDQLETSQDQPLLDQAQKLAANGDEGSLQAAINQAQQVGSGRALYGSAQDKIRQWADQVQRLQAQKAPPIPAPISTPVAPPTNPAPDDNRVQAEQSLQQARAIANGGTPDALAEAISAARNVPAASPLHGEANQAIDQWSQQILQAATNETDVPTAIAIAQKVPVGSGAYSQAQQQISQWRQLIGQ